ncbi:MAG: hypothetical protein AAE977_03030 [Thermoplasmataceae archaeon]|jgi:hypothetical protein
MIESPEKIAVKIWASMGNRKFPESYLKPGTDIREISLTVSDDVIMFRENEFVEVMIGRERYYFLKADEAKFIFYAAKSGMNRIPVPDDEEIKRCIREFEDDLDRWSRALRNAAAEYSLSSNEFNLLIRSFEEISGVKGLF